MTRSFRLAAATVLYEPDPGMLAALAAALHAASVPLFAVQNSRLDERARAVLDEAGDVTLLGDGGNAGLGAGLNLALAAAAARGFSHVLLFDQDSTPDAALPAALLARAEALGPKLAALGPRLAPPPGEGYKPIWYSFRATGPAGARPVDFLPTSGSLVPVAAWRAIGPFRADFFIDGIDVEWCFRAWAAGHEVMLAEDLAMTHRWGRPGEEAGRAQILRQGALRNAYYLRNAAFALRLPHLPWRWKARSLARLAAQAAVLSAKGEGASVARALLDGWRGRLGPLGRGPQPGAS